MIKADCFYLLPDASVNKQTNKQTPPQKKPGFVVFLKSYILNRLRRRPTATNQSLSEIPGTRHFSKLVIFHILEC